jgi:hypothetical protein
MVDREAGEEGPDETRHRVTQGEQAEIARPRRRSANFPRRVLGRELERHEPDAEQRRPREERREPGKATGSVAATPIRTDPSSMGRRAPMRSTTRPATTDSNIGRSA